MNLSNIGNSFQLNNYFAIADKISNIFFFKNNVFISNPQVHFTFVRYAGFLELMLQSFLVYLLQETGPKFFMNFHQATFYFI